MLAADVADAADRAERAPSVRLLPAFDPYVIGATKHATALLPDERLCPRVYRSQGWTSPVLLAGGRMEGVWRHERTGRRLQVALEPFGKLPARIRREAEREAERLAGFLGASSR